MKTIFFHVRIYDDGIGDLSHFVDIYRAMKKYISPDVEFIPVIKYSAEQKEQVVNTLEEMKIQTYSCYETKSALGSIIETIPSLQKGSVESKLADCVLIMQISGYFPDIYHTDNPFVKYINITEHDSNHALERHDKRSSLNPTIQLGLGFSQECFGIKISSPIPKNDEFNNTAFKSLFYEQLACHESESKQNFFVPVYITDIGVLWRAILFLYTNQSLINHNIIIYYSTGLLKRHSECLPRILNANFDLDQGQYNCYLKKSNIKEVTLINGLDPETKPVITTKKLIPLGKRSFKIFYGFWIDNHDYDLLFSQATFAFISGDNTLEKAISNHILPFYISTNYSQKRESYLKLQNLVADKNENLQILFSWDALNFFTRDNSVFENLNLFPRMEELDLMEAIKTWPLVCDIIHKEYHFYDHLKRTLSENLPSRCFTEKPAVFLYRHYNKPVEKLYGDLSLFKTKVKPAKKVELSHSRLYNLMS